MTAPASRDSAARPTTDEWADIMLDALRQSDGGNNPFYADDPDTVNLARELAEAVVAALSGPADPTEDGS